MSAEPAPAAEAQACPERTPVHPDVVLVDGRSGSGKTELARAMVAQMPAFQLVRMDDLYPGWEGLDAGSQHVHDCILAAKIRRWQRWDWAAGEPAEWHVLNPSRPVLIEGCGALSRANRALAAHTVWVELDEATRRARVRTRDGDSWLDKWDFWAAQEQAFIDRENPKALADTVVDGRETF